MLSFRGLHLPEESAVAFTCCPHGIRFLRRRGRRGGVRSMRASGSCVAQPFCFSGKAGDFGAIHPQTISGGQGCRRKAPAFAERRKGWATGLVSSARAESQRLDYINNAAMLSFRGLHLPEESAVAFTRALTESVSSKAVGGAAQRAFDARQRQLCSPAFLLFRKGWGFWSDPPADDQWLAGCRRKAPAFAKSRKGWATGLGLASCSHQASARRGPIDGTAALKDGGYTCFYLLPSRNPFPQTPWAARRSAFDARQRKLCNPAFLLFRKGWGFWSDPPADDQWRAGMQKKSPSLC